MGWSNKSGLTKTDNQSALASNRRLLNRLARWTGPVLLFSIVAFLVGFTVFAERIAGMKTPLDIPPADAIVALTGGQSRLEKSVRLLASRKGRRLLISGAHIDTSKTDLSRAMGVNQSLFDCCVDIGYEAKDTVGNANETVSWLKKNGFKSVILVTNNYHMPRSVLEIRRIDHSIDVRPFPVVNTDLTNGKWMLKPETVRVLLAEYIKYVGAKLRNYLPIPNSLASVLEPSRKFTLTSQMEWFSRTGAQYTTVHEHRKRRKLLQLAVKVELSFGLLDQ